MIVDGWMESSNHMHIKERNRERRYASPRAEINNLGSLESVSGFKRAVREECPHAVRMNDAQSTENFSQRQRHRCDCISLMGRGKLSRTTSNNK